MSVHLRRHAADDDHQVIGGAGGGSQGLHLALDEIRERPGIQNRPRLLIEIALVCRAPALGDEEKVILVALVGIDFDLRREVGPGVLLLVHRKRRHLRVPQVRPGVGLVDSARERLLVASPGEHVLALFREHDGGSRVLAGGEDHARGDVRVLQHLKGDEAIVVARILVVEDPPHLFEVRGAKEVRDVADSLAREKRNRLGLDDENFLSQDLRLSEAIARKLAIRGLVDAELENRLVAERAHSGEDSTGFSRGTVRSTAVAASASTDPKKKGACGPRPAKSPIPCQRIPAMTLAGRAAAPTTAW